MEAMRVANEKTIAAGNMKVNAKGDVLKGGKVVQTAKERVTPSYETVTQTADTSLRKPLARSDAEEVSPKPKKAPEPIEAEMTTDTLKTRDDGSKYREIINPDGDIEVKEVDAPKTKKKTTKKTSKKTKRPTV
jgi:hypothetical protein